MAVTSDPHVFANGDPGLAEAAQSVHTKHDDWVTAFNRQHLGGVATASSTKVGDHISWQQVGALLVMNTPQGVATKKKPIDIVTKIGVTDVDYSGAAFSILLRYYVTAVWGAKAWVSASYAGGPLTLQQMNYLSPVIYPARHALPGWYLLDFGDFSTSAVPDAIRRISVVWYCVKD